MPSSQLPRDQRVEKSVRNGGEFCIALDGPKGEACHIIVGIEDPLDSDFLIRKISADVAEDIANNLLEYVRVLREVR